MPRWNIQLLVLHMLYKMEQSRIHLLNPDNRDSTKEKKPNYSDLRKRANSFQWFCRVHLSGHSRTRH